MNPAYIILTNPHLITNIIYNHKGLQTPTAKIMNDFFNDYDAKLLINNIYFNDWGERMCDELSTEQEKDIIDSIKEEGYYNDMSYWDDYFATCYIKYF